MKKTFTILIAAIAAIMLITQPMQAVGQTRSTYTIALKDNGTNNESSSAMEASPSVSDVLADGTSQVSSISTSKIYQGAQYNGWRFASSNDPGYATFNLNTTAQGYTVSKVTVRAKVYGSDSSSLKVTVTSTNNTAVINESTSSTLTDSFTDYDFTLASPTTIKTIKVETTAKKKRFYVYSIKVTYSSDPSISIASPVTLPATANNGTINVTYADITPGLSSSINLYSSLNPDVPFNGDWFSADFHSDSKTVDYSKIDYTASENDADANTIYMKVTLSDGSKSVTSDPVTINQKGLRKITYKPNGANGSDIISKYSVGDNAEIASNTFTTPAGKMFLEWNTASNGSGDNKQPGDIVEGIDADLDLYAIWVDNYTLTLNSNGMVSTVEVVQNGYYDLETPNNVPTGYSFIGWASDDEDPTNSLVDSHYQVTGNTPLYALFRAGGYTKVTAAPEAPNTWAGEYLIVYEYNATTGYVWTGVDANNCYMSKPISAGTIGLADNLVTVTVASMTGGYSIKVNAGTNKDKYISGTSGSNIINYGDSEGLNTLEYASGVKITSNTSVMVYNTSDNRFRYYKSSTYSSYPTIQLYKLTLGDYTLIVDNPTISGDVEITTPTTISSSQTFSGDLDITETLTIGGSAVVTVEGDITNSSAANLVIEDGGQLITSSSVQLTYKKGITSAAKDGGWYTISTPVHTASNTFLEHESVENLILASESNYDLFYYNEATHYWMNYKQAEFDLNIGQGYLYRNNGAELHFAGYNNQATSYNVALSYASSEDKLLGFNLIGNPYPQNITMSDVTVNNGGTLSGGYVLSKDGAWSADVAATIAPAQGFLVQIDKTGVTATITKPTGGSKSRANNDYIKFIVANSQHEDAAFALFEEGYGLNKIDHRNSDIPMLYIPKEGHNFAIATMAYNTQSFNLNLKAKTTGKYTLTYKATGNYSYLHVIDRLTGEDVDMLMEGEYSFIASPSDAENRFIVRLEYMNGLDSSEDSIFAYQSGSDIIVNGEGELQIFDVMGRRVATQYVSGVETINLQLNGVFIFKLNEKTQKIVVR